MNKEIKEEFNNKLFKFENVTKLKNLEDNIKNNNKKDVTSPIESINNKLNNLQNSLNNYGTKIKNLEDNLRNSQKSTKVDEKNNQNNERIIELENITKDIEARINDYDIDQIIQNLSILMEKANDTEIYEKINNLETEINQIREISKKPVESQKNIESRNNNLSDDVINRINNIENIIQSFENQFQKIENDNQNTNNYTNNLDKKTSNFEKKLSNITKLSEDLQNRTDSLFKITKNLDNLTKELDNRTNNIMNNVARISSERDSNPNINKNMEKLRNVKNIPNNIIEKNKINNVYIDDNRGMKKNIAPNYGKGNNIIETNNGYQIMIKSKENTNTFNNTYNNNNKQQQPKNYGESNYYYTIKPGNNVNYNYIDSKIVNYDDIIFLKNRIKEMHPKINNILFNLVYRATEDGDKAADFHHKCDKIGPNITLIKTKKGYVFGGFTFKNWEHMQRDIDPNKPNLGSASRDSRAFGFSVNNQKIYNNEKPNEFAIWCNRNFGPTFKNNLFQIFDSCLRKGGYCSIKSNSHFGGQNYDYEISGGESRFRVVELEVYEVKLL